ncbi:MAG: glycosyltransferase [Patescibacteria group bacterium]
MTQKKIDITIAIPTCYGGQSLVDTVETIVQAAQGLSVEILIQADRTPLTPEVKAKLKKLGAQVAWNDVEGSQFKKLKQLLDKAQGEIFVFTQDDITFAPAAIKEIQAAFARDKKLTMTGSRVLPLPPVTTFEKSMAVMVRIVDHTAGYWRNGNNYLAASGRCLAFRTETFRKFRIPEMVVNGDMFLYLENKSVGGKFKQLKKSHVFIRCPQKLRDQVGPSSRFQFSKQELVNYFDFPIDKEYKVSRRATARAIFKELVEYPSATFGYFFIYVYTRLRRQSYKKVSNPVWDVDASTKS